jgi:hypothetical protein
MQWYQAQTHLRQFSRALISRSKVKPSFFASVFAFGSDL